jgi:cytoskeletal protein RodZ
MEITGKILKEGREKTGQTLSEVSLATKINLKVLEAMEKGDKTSLPPVTFLRGFVRSYAKYLKLDEDAIMQSFFEEMGSARPEKRATQAEISEATPKTVADNYINTKNLTSKYIVTSIIIALICFILIVRGIVSKYEKEALIPPQKDIEKIVNADTPEETINNANPENENQTMNEVNGQTSTDSTTEINEPVLKSPTPNLEPPAVSNTVSPTQINPPQINPPPNVVTKPTPPIKDESIKPVPIKPEIQKPEPPKVEIPKKLPEKIPPTESAATVPQEVIVEALDNTSFTVKIDNLPKKTIQLKASELHFVKAKSSIVIDFADGGAISVIYNGQNKGVPGDLGKSKSLTYP